MALTREAAQARLSTKLTRDVREALEPLARREHFAIDLEVRLNPPGPNEEAWLARLGAFPRDEDLLPLVEQVRVRVTVDQNIRKPALEVVRSTVSGVVDPLRARTGDFIEVTYADLSSLKGLRPRSIAKKAAAPVVKKAESAPAPTVPVVASPPPPVVIPSAPVDWTYPSIALLIAAAVVAFGVWSGFTAFGRRVQRLVFDWGDRFSQGLESIRSTVATGMTLAPMERGGSVLTAPAPSIASTATPQPSSVLAFPSTPIQVAIVSAPPVAPVIPLSARPSSSRAESGAPQAPRVRPVSSYTLERQLNAKRKVLFQNPGAVARVLAKRVPERPEEEQVLAGFLRSLAPKETEAMSRYLNADDLLRFSKLASKAHERASVNRLISFVEEIAPEVATLAGLTVPIARAVELIEKFDPEPLAMVVKECSTEVAAAVLRGIPPEKREEVFARFDGQAREGLLKQISTSTSVDPATAVPAIVESAVRVCLRQGLKELLLLWVSESRTLLSRERHEALLRSVREEASGLIADPRS